MRFQTNIALTQSAADWLDTQALAIRKNKRTYVSRSAFVRAVVHGIADSGLDLSHCQSEAAIAVCLSIAIRVFLEVPLTPELPMYTTEPLGTPAAEEGRVQEKTAPRGPSADAVSRLDHSGVAAIPAISSLNNSPCWLSSMVRRYGVPK
jgi:hypothetical protein